MWIGFGLCLGIARVCVKEFFPIFCGNADPGEEQDPRSDGLWWKGYSRGRSPTARNTGRKGARSGAGAGSPRPLELHPGHTGRGTPAARPRGRAAGRGTARDTNAPHNSGRRAPPGTVPPPPPRHAAPTGRASEGDSAGPPHPHTRADSTWVSDPDSPLGGQAVGGGGGLAPDAPRNGASYPCWERPSASPAARNNSSQGRTLWGWCWVPKPAPTASGTHGSRNPGCPPEKTGRRGRDGA